MCMVCFGNHTQLNIKKRKKKKNVIEGSGSSLLIISA